MQTRVNASRAHHQWKNKGAHQKKTTVKVTVPPFGGGLQGGGGAISSAKVPNEYGPYTCCSLDKGLAYLNTYNYRHTHEEVHGMSAP